MDVRDAAIAYAAFHKIMAEDVVGHLESRCCMVPDQLVVAESNIPQTCRFEYGIFIDRDEFSERSFGMPLDTFEATFARACDHWNERIGINLHLTRDFAAAKCVVGFQSLGGSTLAWSHIANNSCADDKSQKYDQPRNWTVQQLFLTIIHELGHLLGLGHASSGIMKPIIDGSLSGTTDYDISRARDLGYGPPQPSVPPTPDPPTPDPEPPAPIDYNRLIAALKSDAGFIDRVTGPQGERGRVGADGHPGPQGPKGDPGGLDQNTVVAMRHAKTTLEKNAGLFRWPSAARGLIDAINKALNG